MNHKELKDKIVEKHGSIRIFSEAAGLKKKALDGFLYRSDDEITEDEQKRIDAHEALCDKLKPIEDSKKLTMEESGLIGEAVIYLYGTIREMTFQNRNWSDSAIRNLIKGRTRQKTPRVIALINKLTQEAEEKMSSEIVEKLKTIK